MNTPSLLSTVKRVFIIAKKHSINYNNSMFMSNDDGGFESHYDNKMNMGVYDE